MRGTTRRINVEVFVTSFHSLKGSKENTNYSQVQIYLNELLKLCGAKVKAKE